MVRVDLLHRPAPVLRVLLEFVFLRLGRLIVGRNACVNRYSSWFHAFLLSAGTCRAFPASRSSLWLRRLATLPLQVNVFGLMPFAMADAWSA